MFFENEFVHQALLYTGNEFLQYTFRVELRMKDNVDLDALRYALDTTMKRYPYFAIRVVENGAYLDSLATSDKKHHEQQYSAAKCLKCGLCLEECPNYHLGGEFF